MVSQFFESDMSVALPLLLVATAFLGVGFGLTVPALNTLTAAFHPAAVESSVLVVNALRAGARRAARAAEAAAGHGDRVLRGDACTTGDLERAELRELNRLVRETGPATGTRTGG